jgi:hypothetical protein
MSVAFSYSYDRRADMAECHMSHPVIFIVEDNSAS